MRAVYYRIKGLAPWVHCWRHGIARGVTREEHTKFMATKSQAAQPPGTSSNPEQRSR